MTKQDTTSKHQALKKMQTGQKPVALDLNQLPEPVLPDEPGFLDLYWQAWRLAWDHVREHDGIPQTPYMDEGFSSTRIWIWDTCFMVHFCKYAPQIFPGIQSLDNFYGPMHQGFQSSLLIHHPDNPPLFAWIEHEYFRFTGDRSRICRILIEEQLLQKHFAYFDRPNTGYLYPYAGLEVYLRRHPHGFEWNGNASGMDNSPREDSMAHGERLLWVDAIAQHALAAMSISKLGKVIGANEIVDCFQEKYESFKEILNRYYWNEEDGIYYDITLNEPHRHSRVKTPASYWPLLAGVASQHQAERMLEHLLDPLGFGGKVPWTTVERRDPAYVKEGMYWRGGVWLPTAYMATKALEHYGYEAAADAAAERLLRHMVQTYKDYEPHTIWECYSPEEAKPSTGKDNVYIVRPDFCGWSALGPISMLIENILGFHDVDAIEKTVKWRLYRNGRHGIKRLRFGTVIADIVSENGMVTVHTNESFTLVINGKSFSITAGESQLKYDVS